MTISLFLPQVTRIPITGPAPYNTLVCVQTETAGGGQVVQAGKLSRWSSSVTTTFKLAGFDQRVPPVFEHSTTAFLSSIGPFEDDTWLMAVDSVTGAGFNPVDGTYFVNFDVALMPGSPAPGTCVALFGAYGVCFYFGVVQITSFVLCYEPPLPTPPPTGGIAVSAEIASFIRNKQALNAAERMISLLGAPGALSSPSSSTSTGDPKQTPCKCK
jgi:hypothetical protein